MKKAWLILLFASFIFMGLKIIFPKKSIDNFFSRSSGNQFQELLNEQLNDTIKEKQIRDSILLVEKNRIRKLAKKEKKKLDSINKIIAYKRKNRKGLKHFFDKLYDLEHNRKKQIRIAFFGDSMEDGDMIVMQFRNYLQRKFGGLGVGYVPMKSLTSKGRNTIIHRFTRSWKQSSFMRKGYGRFAFGLNGNTFYVGNNYEIDSAQVSFKKGIVYKNLPLIYPKIIYGKQLIDSTYNGTIPQLTYALNDGLKFKNIPLDNTKLINIHSLPNNPKKITLRIKDQQTTPFYGMSFASKYGIIVDNLAIRGNSGLPIIKLNKNLMQQFDRHMKYDLIIIAYGTNIFSFNNTNYKWYKSKMIRNIKHIQRCFPKADILISSMGDRSTNIDATMQTPEHLPDFINTQRQIALATKSGFYNLYEQMGGENSMRRWVEELKFANKDYTHFNSKGAQEAGRLLYTWFLSNYKEYIKKRNKKALLKIKKRISNQEEELVNKRETLVKRRKILLNRKKRLQKLNINTRKTEN